MTRGAVRAWWSESLAALRSERRRLVLPALPWVLSLVVGLPLLWNEIQTAVERPRQQARQDTMREAAQVSLRTVDRLRRDVGFLASVTARLAQTPDYLAPSSALVTTFASFSESAADYDQVRWLGLDGKELLRVDNRDGKAVRLPEGELQDHAGQRHFSEAVRLPPGGAHVSPIELSSERGVVQVPHQPIIRIATPVDHDGVRMGVIVLDLQAERTLQRVQELSSKRGLETYLAGPWGHWIIGPDAAGNWARQLGKTGYTLQETHPELWRRIQAGESGRWKDWSYTSLSPPVATHRDDNGGDHIPYLRLLIRDQDDLSLRERRWQWLLGLLGLAGTALAVMVILQQARGMARDTAHNQELRSINQALVETNERLHVVQEELARAQRLSSLGLMVAGVAHEMNTPLGGALLALSTLKAQLDGLLVQLDGGLRRSQLDRFLTVSQDAIALVHAEITRSAELVQRFKQLAVDRTSHEHRRFELAEAILDSDPRVRRGDLGEKIELVLDLEPGIVMDSCPGPLGQVISNLVGNVVVHAFAGGESGELRIASRSGPGDAVTITVADTGNGVPAAELPRIFEPFFTTRRGDGGTGLGLHIVHQLVTEVLGGTIHAASQPSEGTTFTIRIPRHLSS